MVRFSLFLALAMLCPGRLIVLGDSETALTLAPGSRHNTEVGVGETHRYSLEVEVDEYLELVVFQQKSDVSIALSDPTGRQVQAIDDQRLGHSDPESLHWIAESTGRYQLTVRSVGASSGAYQLRWVAHGPATAADRLLIPAARKYARARGLQQRDERADWRAAIELYQQILPVWRQLEQPDYEASTLDNIGSCHRSLEETTTAESFFARAVELWTDRGAKAKSLHNLAAARNALGQPRAAINDYEMALVILTGEARQELQIAKTRRALADAYRSAGRLADAEAELLAALEVFERRGRDRDRCLALNTLGSVYSHMGRVDEAFAALRQAREMADTGDRLGIRTSAAVAANLASLHDWIGEPMLAIADLHRSIELNRQVDDRTGEAAAARQLGLLYRDVAQFDQALEHLELSASLKEALGKKAEAAEARVVIADIHRRQGRTAEALEILEQISPVLESHGNLSVRISAFEKRGLVLAAGGHVEEARTVFRRAVALLDNLEEPSRKARLLAAVGHTELAAGALDSAHGYLVEALELARTCRDHDPEVPALVDLARLERQRGHLEMAQAHAEEALDVIEAIRGRAGGERFRASYLTQQLDAFELTVDILLARHRHRPDQGFDVQAFAVSERMRARSLHDFVAFANADLRAGVDPQLVERERELRHRINALEHRLQTHGGAMVDEDARRLDQTLTMLVREYREVEGRIFRQSPRFEEIAQPRTTSLREAQRQILDADTVLLEVLLGEERSWLWAVTADTHRTVELPPRAALEDLARQVREHLTLPAGRSSRETLAERRSWPQRLAAGEALYVMAGTQLSTLLLSPVADLVAGRRLVVVADGALLLVPFAALPAPGSVPGDWQPILAGHEVVQAPSASVLAALRRRSQTQKSPDRLLAIFADPVFEAGDTRLARAATRGPIQNLDETTLRGAGTLKLHRLRYTGQEAEAILALARGHGQVLAALGLEATRQRALDEELDRFRYLHFATHGILDDHRPELSAIALSMVDRAGWKQPGLLHLHDIYNLRLAADLVTLSACDTAVGKQVRGEGLMSLTRGFLHAGVPSVLASLWQIDDRATGELMRRFYEPLLAESAHPSAALRQAVLATREAAEPHHRHPYYWGAFVLFGDWR